MTALLPIADTPEMRRQALRLAGRHRRAVVAVVLLHAFAAAAGLIGPPILGSLVQSLQTGIDTAKIDRAVLLLSAFLLLQTVLTFFARRSSFVLSERMFAELREDFMRRVLSLPLSIVERAGIGDLVSRTTADVDSLARTVRFAIPETSIACVTALLVVGAAVWVSPIAALPCIVGVPILVIGTRWYLSLAPGGYLWERAAYASLAGTVGETVDGGPRSRRSRSRTSANGGSTPTSRTPTTPSGSRCGCARSGSRRSTSPTCSRRGGSHMGRLARRERPRHGGRGDDRRPLYPAARRPRQPAALVARRGAGRRRLLRPSRRPSRASSPTARRPGRSPRTTGSATTSATPTCPAATCSTASGSTSSPGGASPSGPSGAGKSTLGRLLAGIHPPRTGSVEVRGRPARQSRARDAPHREVALVDPGAARLRRHARGQPPPRRVPGSSDAALWERPRRRRRAGLGGGTAETSSRRSSAPEAHH